MHILVNTCTCVRTCARSCVGVVIRLVSSMLGGPHIYASNSNILATVYIASCPVSRLGLYQVRMPKPIARRQIAGGAAAKVNVEKDRNKQESCVRYIYTLHRHGAHACSCAAIDHALYHGHVCRTVFDHGFYRLHMRTANSFCSLTAAGPILGCKLVLDDLQGKLRNSCQ